MLIIDFFFPPSHSYLIFFLQIESLHIKKIRIILWVTSMIDTDSSNFNDTVKFGVLVR